MCENLGHHTPVAPAIPCHSPSADDRDKDRQTPLIFDASPILAWAESLFPVKDFKIGCILRYQGDVISTLSVPRLEHIEKLSVGEQRDLCLAVMKGINLDDTIPPVFYHIFCGKECRYSNTYMVLKEKADGAHS